MGWTKQPFVDQETVITANFLNGLQDQIILDEETIEDVESVQKVANAGKTVTIGLNGKLSASGGSGLTDRVKSALLGIFQHVAYADDRGQAYYNELYNALNNVELTGVEATFNQGTMEVYPSTPLDSLKNNLVVKAVYSNGEKVTTDDYTLSGTLQVGTSTVTVTCGDYTDTFDVNVSSVAVTGIECVFNQGTAVIYESDSLTSLKQYLTVKVVYSDGTKEETINYSLSGTLVAGTSTITATYGSFTDTFDVVVSAVAVTSISCTYTQSKTVYDSDSLDVLKDDLVVNAVYSDGSSGTVSASDYTLSGTLNEGTSTITVSYGGKTDTFNVTVTHLAGSYSVANSLTNCTNSNGASSVIENESYSGTITANAGYTMTGATVSITMGGTDITSTAYNNGAISIASVTGNVVITASAVQITDNLIATLALGTHEVYPTDNIQSLKKYLTVELHNGGTTTPVSEYTLSGSIDSVGTHAITISYNNYTTTVNVPVVANTTGILYEWDFTDSLTDLRQNQTALLQTGEGWEIPGKSAGTTAPVRGSAGIVFNDAQQLARLLPTSMEMTSWLRNKTVQIDVASFSPVLNTDNDPYVPGTQMADIDCTHIRFLVVANHYSLGPDGDIADEYFHMETGIGYGVNAQGQYNLSPIYRDFDNKGWGIVTKKVRLGYADPDATTKSIGFVTKEPFSEIRSAVDAISGHTVSVYIDNAGHWRMYIDNDMIGMAKEAIDYDIYGLQIGAGGRPFYGGGFYNALITGARIYKGNIFDATDRIIAGFYAFDGLVYTDMNLNDIKQYLTVAYVHNGVDTILQDSEYTLSGTLTEGMNTITITYRKLTTTIAVRAWQKVNTVSVSGGQLFKTSGAIYNKSVSGIGKTMAIEHGNLDAVQRSLYTTQGVKPALLVDGTFTSFYPIPVPSNAVKVVITDLLPLRNFHFFMGLWSYDSNANKYTYIEGSDDWSGADSFIYSLPTTGNNLYLTVRIRHKDADTSPIPVEPTDCKLVFVRGGE